MARRIATDKFENEAMSVISKFIDKNTDKIKTKLRQILQEPIEDDDEQWDDLFTKMEIYIFDNLMLDDMDLERFLNKYLSPEQLYEYVGGYFEYLEGQHRSASLWL